MRRNRPALCSVSRLVRQRKEHHTNLSRPAAQSVSAQDSEDITGAVVHPLLIYSSSRTLSQFGVVIFENMVAIATLFG